VRKQIKILEQSELTSRLGEMPDIYIEAFTDLLEQLREQAFSYATAPEAAKDSHYTAHCNGGAYYLDLVITGLLDLRNKAKA
jgi:hypothetical protein